MKRVIAAFVLIGSSIGLLGGTAAAPATGATPVNGRILFSRCGNVIGCQIFTANPDGTAIHRVTRGGDNFSGDWSPDGSKIVYVSTRSGDTTIWIARADGSHARQLTHNSRRADDVSPRFTPDGQRVLFVNCEGGDCDGGIGSVNIDGTGLHLVTPNSGSSYNLADPSPDGTQMAYMRWHVGGVKMAVYVSDADGTNERRVTPPSLLAWLPDWSPLGDRIVFSTQVFFDRPAPVIYSVLPDGTGLQQLTQAPARHADWAASYSPDGTTIIFGSDRRFEDYCCGDLFTIPASGGAMSRVKLPYDAYDARWGTAPIETARTTVTRSFRATGRDLLCERVPVACGP